MSELIIIGGSGFGKEVCWLANRLNIKVKGFLDDTPEKQGKMIMGSPVLGVIVDFEKYLDYDFIVAIGSPRGRKSVVSKLSKEVSYATLIDPTAIVDRDSVGAGSIICAGVIVTVDVKIGLQTIVNLNSTIGHGCIVGDFVTVAPNASISGNVNIDNLVEIGTGSAILEKTTLGYGSVLGMGAILVKNLESNKLAVGTPAKAIKSID